jgi:phage gp29-like protein
MNPFKKIAAKAATILRPRPDQGEINVLSLYNRWRQYPANGMTPESLQAILQEADQGNISKQMELMSEIQQKDPQIFSCFNRRSRSVLKRQFQVNAADSTIGAYKGHADYVAKVIKGVKDFQNVRFNGLDAVGKGFSAQQIMWKVDPAGNPYIDRFEWLDQRNFRTGLATDMKSDLNIIRRLTDENLIDGFPLEQNKWFVPIIKAVSGNVGAAGLLRTCAWYYLFKNFDIKAWIQFAELYGMPLRLGKYQVGASEKEKEDLRIALQTIGQDASGIMPVTTQIELKEAMSKAASFDSFEKLADYCDTQNSKAILGHSAAVDSTAGKLGNESNADDAIYDIIESDASAFDDSFNDQVVKPITIYKFGPQELYPRFQTLVVPPMDRKLELDLMNRFQQPLPKTFYYSNVGFPVPVENEEVVMPVQVSVPPGNLFGTQVPAKDVIASDKKKSQ